MRRLAVVSLWLGVAALLGTAAHAQTPAARPASVKIAIIVPLSQWQGGKALTVYPPAAGVAAPISPKG